MVGADSHTERAPELAVAMGCVETSKTVEIDAKKGSEGGGEYA